MGKKIGYVRICPKQGESDLMELSELYQDKEYLALLREKQLSGQVSLFCGCVEDNSLPLAITQTGVIRVARNGQQELHHPSCPKSAYYEAGLKKVIPGISLDGDGGRRGLWQVKISNQ